MENVAKQTSQWDRVLAILEPKLGHVTFDTWFRPTRQISFEGDRLKIHVPNEMFAEWLRSQYLADIRAAVIEAGMTGPPSIVFCSPKPVEPTKSATSIDPTMSLALNPRYTFSNFVVSSCNEFAHAAAQAVIENPGNQYNPLFLHGGVGLGKTHLMQAIGNELLRTHPSMKLRYLTSETFMNELITAIRFENTAQFRDRYRSVDILLVDDIQFFAGKESTQEEFFHTFNALYDMGHQIVIASDCPPKSIPSIEERLRSRFEWGLLADIQPPDLETKVAILNKLSHANSWQVPPEVALYIASNVHDNIRELEGCLTTLVAASSIQGRPIDLKLAQEVIKSRKAVDDEQPVAIEEIMRAVAGHFRLRVSELKAKTNARRISYPRQLTMYLGKKLAQESFPSLGRRFSMHHTTVIHAVRKIERLRGEDPSVSRLITSFEEQLR